jgi:NADH-quinone oxidoreductase subunit L
VGLPFTPSFIGIDLMFSHVDHDEYLLIILTSISFLVLELSVLRIYARLFLGPNQKQDHPYCLPLIVVDVVNFYQSNTLFYKLAV